MCSGGCRRGHPGTVVKRERSSLCITRYSLGMMIYNRRGSATHPLPAQATQLVHSEPATAVVAVGGIGESCDGSVLTNTTSPNGLRETPGEGSRVGHDSNNTVVAQGSSLSEEDKGKRTVRPFRIWICNVTHACSAGPVGRLICGEPSFTATEHNHTCGELQLHSLVGLSWDAMVLTNTTSPTMPHRNLIV